LFTTNWGWTYNLLIIFVCINDIVVSINDIILLLLRIIVILIEILYVLTTTTPLNS
jgi:hypothetical protein